MALIGGFYNSKKDIDGRLDRPYTAKDLREPYDAIYTDGIKPDPDGTVGNNFKVEPVSNYTVRVKTGHAKLGGAWIKNDEDYEIKLDQLSGNTTKYYMIVLMNDEVAREPKLNVIDAGSVEPTGIEKNISDGYRVCLAYIKLSSTDRVITNDMIVDTRERASFCGVMSGVGATILKTYHNSYKTINANEQNIPIGIPEYDGTFRTELTVMVEGRVITGWTVSADAKTVHLPNALPVQGTKVDFYVIRNVNGAVTSDVVGDVVMLSSRMSGVERNMEHHYYCNGVTDNVEIGNIVRKWMSGGLDYSSMRLIIHGNIGVTLPMGGSGTTSSPYSWFTLSGTYATRRCILDFSDCSQLYIPVTSGTQNIIFNGSVVCIKGLNLQAGDDSIPKSSNNTGVVVFNSTIGIINCEDCRFWINGGNGTTKLSSTGLFKNCYCKMVTRTNSIVFSPTSGSYLKIEGGEYYAYATTYGGDIVVVNQTTANSVVILENVNMPSHSESGLSQEYNINHKAGYFRCRDLMGTLPYNNLTTSSGVMVNSIEVDIIETV